VLGQLRGGHQPGGQLLRAGGGRPGNAAVAVDRQAAGRDAAQRAQPGVPALAFELLFTLPAAGPQPRQFPADPRSLDDRQQPGAAPGGVFGQPPPKVIGAVLDLPTVRYGG
jgi:hypothetical protein